jgi:hypothetical protein
MEMRPNSSISDITSRITLKSKTPAWEPVSDSRWRKQKKRPTTPLTAFMVTVHHADDRGGVGWIWGRWWPEVEEDDHDLHLQHWAWGEKELHHEHRQQWLSREERNSQTHLTADVDHREPADVDPSSCNHGYCHIGTCQDPLVRGDSGKNTSNDQDESTSG